MGFHLFLLTQLFSKKGNEQELQKFLTFYSEQEAIEKLVGKKQNNKTTV